MPPLSQPAHASPAPTSDPAAPQQYERAELTEEDGARGLVAQSDSQGDAEKAGETGAGETGAGLSVLALVRLSRPRFWMYLIGPFVVGLLAGADSPGALLDWRALCFGLFFLFPANLFVYGVNDAHDFETDALNSKKQGYEARLQRSARRLLLAASAGACAPFALLAFFVAPARAVVMLGLFFLLAHQYSAPPIRAKGRPFVDSLFNLLYACPAFFGHALLGGTGVDWSSVLAAWCWVTAMHAYSAVPDIQADQQAKVATIATMLGMRPAILLCAALYALSAAASYAALGWLSPLLGALYLAMMAFSAQAAASQGAEGVMKLYRFFPLLNTAAGFLLFWRVAWIKFAPEILGALPSL